MALFKYEFSSDQPGRFRRAILPCHGVPVVYHDQVLDTVAIWEQGYILMDIPDDLISKIRTRRAIVNPCGTLLTSTPAEGEKYEQIDSIDIFDNE